MTNILDPTDIAICKLLLGNAKMTMKVLGKEIFLSEEAARSHVKRLEDLGFIMGYHATLDSAKFNKVVLMYYHIKLISNAGNNLKLFMDKSKESIQIINCQQVAADGYDFIVTVESPSLNESNRIITAELCDYFDIYSISNAVVLSETRVNKISNFSSRIKKDLNKVIVLIASFSQFLNVETISSCQL
ncbi:Lrp/AsnC family transcriptional regulator [Pedobacter sp. JCM 36344]|uniref:Lrp/AsnC family transcriptional regulator n=1 Tax=Pedobacter sp. JCM 36344 TaxID=3374280 RepID=UPI00397B23FB